MRGEDSVWSAMICTARVSVDMDLSLARGPVHRASAHDVNVQVEHRLPRFRTAVDDRPVPGAVDPLLARYPGRDREQVPEQALVLLPVVERLDVSPRNHEHVHRRLR